MRAVVIPDVMTVDPQTVIVEVVPTVAEAEMIVVIVIVTEVTTINTIATPIVGVVVVITMRSVDGITMAVEVTINHLTTRMNLIM